jgi:hypothetical protein
LSIVALVQLYAARTSWLTPWKGGGFGMFSTVDSPGARFLRIELETDSGPVRVAVPAQLLPDASRLREAPDKAALRDLASALAAGTWVPDRRVSAEASYATLLSAASSLDGSIPPSTDALPEDKTYRMLNDSASPSAATLHVKEVRAELWRYHVDASTTSLVANRLMEVRIPVQRP